MRQSSVIHAYYMLGVWGHGPQKNFEFYQSQDSILGYFSACAITDKIEYSYLKLNINTIINSVWVGDYFIRVSDCSIRVFRYFAACLYGS